MEWKQATLCGEGSRLWFITLPGTPSLFLPPHTAAYAGTKQRCPPLQSPRHPICTADRTPCIRTDIWINIYIVLKSKPRHTEGFAGHLSHHCLPFSILTWNLSLTKHGVKSLEIFVEKVKESPTPNPVFFSLCIKDKSKPTTQSSLNKMFANISMQNAWSSSSGVTWIPWWESRDRLSNSNCTTAARNINDLGLHVSSLMYHLCSQLGKANGFQLPCSLSSGDRSRSLVLWQHCGCHLSHRWYRQTSGAPTHQLSSHPSQLLGLGHTRTGISRMCAAKWNLKCHSLLLPFS